ncbi:carboxypeptidase-like regulatory domain-containing protein [Solirubrobacter phytolaccae]|uniref:Carboxypeptidase-like regulatory domain-containing protein n=1 Tax=Solirubrobacter phytolaccae TaxID=1404360 RepID=A0A9X3NIL3_9ACTN|nr:carboxypeptidase-like regulatory domain-containing protein [Solirubrobacter phytolaccae]MDA0181992.1 carboxypeptidase-like regulatory domain-containing protein [Solirubrobacter phytolaccae]
MAGNEYEFCPSTNSAYDSAGCVRTRSSFDATRAKDDVSVPAEGAWRLRVAHRDAAANTDLANSTSPGPLRFDATPPSGEFEPFDPRDPSRIWLRASDATSGVARVEIEARSDGETAWHTLKVDGDAGSYSAVLDDALYPRGSYEVRARVFDRAENERSIMQTAQGTPLRVALPVRVETRMDAGRATKIRTNKRGKPKYKQVLDARPVVAFGRTTTVSGKVTDPAGNPRAGVVVDVLERVDAPARPWQAIGTVQTNAAGMFTFKVSKGASWTLRFSYGGSPTTQPASKEVELRVRAAATIAPDRRVRRNGDEVVFRGRVRSGPVPEAGKLVTLQALTRRGWTTFGNARARAKDGRWSYRYRFTGTTVRSRYTFRVVVPAESGYPYARGASKTTRVIVNP